MSVYSAGDYGDTIKYVINGTAYNLSTAGSAAGVATEIAVSAGDVFEFQTWGSTSSSSYSASFDNFSFTPGAPEPEPVTVNGFIGDYAVEAWNVQNFFSAPVTFTATDLVVDVPTSGDYVFPSITAISDSTIGFSWDMGPYNANLGFEYRINGVAHVLGGAGNASGVVTDINVSIGDVFGFYFNNGYDDGVSDYIVTIDNFNVTAREADPEPVFCEEC